MTKILFREMGARIVRYLRHALIASVATEISRATRYYDRVIQAYPLPHDDLFLLNQVESSHKSHVPASAEFPDLSAEGQGRVAVLLNGNLNHDDDIAALLKKLGQGFSRSTRIFIVAFNPYLRWVYLWLNRLGLREAPVPMTFLTRTAFENIVALAGFKTVRVRPVSGLGRSCGRLGTLLNCISLLLPFVRRFYPIQLLVLRPIQRENSAPSLSILVPVRNERGNLAAALQQLASLRFAEIEIIVIEGNSTDGTWEELQQLLPIYSATSSISCYRQTGKGKADAVRLGFEKAACDLVCILDGDLTVPVARLHEFYEAWCAGHGDFVNGNRLVYPYEEQAMAFLNRLGNVFFAKALASILEIPIGDALCGTKLFRREDWDRFKRWRNDFGNFDPFGDFELLFPASQLALGVVEVPIPYRRRVYGQTNIHRFRDGYQLLKMVLVGLFRVKRPL